MLEQRKVKREKKWEVLEKREEENAELEIYEGKVLKSEECWSKKKEKMGWNGVYWNREEEGAKWNALEQKEVKNGKKWRYWS